MLLGIFHNLQALGVKIRLNNNAFEQIPILLHNLFLRLTVMCTKMISEFHPDLIPSKMDYFWTGNDKPGTNFMNKQQKFQQVFLFNFYISTSKFLLYTFNKFRLFTQAGPHAYSGTIMRRRC